MAAGDVRILANRIVVHVEIKGDDPSRVASGLRYALEVDETGHVEIQRPDPMVDHPAFMDAVSVLCDIGFCQWERIGPEDSEVFLTAEAMEKLDLKAVSQGWQTWEGNHDADGVPTVVPISEPS